MKSIKQYALAVPVFLVLSFVIWLLFETYWPVEVMHVNKLSIENTGSITVGDSMVYALDYCESPRYANVQAEVSITFVDHLLYDMPSISGFLPSGCNSIRVSLRVPPIAPGRYHIQMRRIYMINAFRSVEIDATSRDFEVEPNASRRDRTKLIEANDQLLRANQKLIDINKALILRIDRLLTHSAAR